MSAPCSLGGSKGRIETPLGRFFFQALPGFFLATCQARDSLQIVRADGLQFLLVTAIDFGIQKRSFNDVEGGDLKLPVINIDHSRDRGWRQAYPPLAQRGA